MCIIYVNYLRNTFISDIRMIGIEVNKESIHDDIFIRKVRLLIMDQLMDILTEVNSDVDYETCDTLVDDGILDSFDIVSIVGELNDTFDIEITPVDIVPENFNSAEAMWEMIQRLSDN